MMSRGPKTRNYCRNVKEHALHRKSQNKWNSYSNSRTRHRYIGKFMCMGIKSLVFSIRLNPTPDSGRTASNLPGSSPSAACSHLVRTWPFSNISYCAQNSSPQTAGRKEGTRKKSIVSDQPIERYSEHSFLCENQTNVFCTKFLCKYMLLNR